MNGRLLLTRILRGHAVLKRMQLVMVFLLLGAIGVQAQDVATVTTDKDDYSPGQYVIVTGAGWTPGETVSFDFHETPKVCTSDHHERSTVAKEDGSILYDQFLINEKHLGVAFVLTATGQSSGLTAVTHFTDAGLRNVSVTGTSFCAGDIVNVSFEAVANVVDGSPNGNFGANNNFLVQLSNALGSFANPVTIYTQPGRANNYTVTATIPENIVSGSNYRIRVISTSPASNEPNNGTNISISAKPTIANAGIDQLDAVGTYTTLTGNVPNVGTGTWSIVSGSGGSFGTTAATTSTNPAATFNGTVGESYTLRWTISNGSCKSSTDEVQIRFNQIPTSTSVLNASATYGDPSVTLSSTVSPNPGSGSVDFYVNDVKVGTGVVGEGGVASIEYIPSSLNATSASVSHTIIAKFLGSGYYTESTSAAGTLTINKANQVISWSTPESITYGTALSASQLNASLTTGDGALSFTPVLGTVLNAGENQTLTVTAAGTNNYNEATASVEIDVAKATPSVAIVVGGPYTYDGTAKSIISTSVTGVGGANLGAASVSYKKGESAVAAPINAGEYEVLASFTENDNYNAATASNTLVINKAEASFVASNLTHVYDGTTKSITVTTSPVGLTGVTLSNNGRIDVGSNTVGISLVNENYQAEATSALLEISPRVITVTADAGQTKVYGAIEPALTYQITSGELVNNSHITGSLKRATGENVSTYDISQGTLAATSNYSLQFVGSSFSITPKAVTASISATDKEYDGTATASAIGSISTDQLVGDDVLEVTTSNAAFDSKHVGTNKVVTAGVSITDGNYTLRYTTATASANITAKEISGTFVAQNKEYDGSSGATVVTRGLVGAIQNDKVELTGGTATFADVNAGTGKVVTLSGATLSGDDRNNYTLTGVSTALANITQKAAAVSPIANTKIYGAADPVLYGTLEGFLAADKVTAAYSRLPGETVAGGPYTISATLSPAGVLNNYAITYNTANFSITKASLAVTADNATKVYGDVNPVFAGTVTGIQNNDAIAASYTSVATITSGIGTYDIVPALSGAALENYTVTPTNGTLTVTKAPLTVVANNKSRVYGVENPELDGTLTGVKNNDAITVSYSTTADVDSNVDKYAITASLIDPDNRLGNYTVSNTAGTLTITQAPATIAVTELSKAYNRTAQGATVITSPVGLAVSVTYDGAAAEPTAAGSYTVVAALNNSNYSAVDGEGTLVIAPKAVTAALANAGKVYDGNSAANNTTATLEGVISPDKVSTTVTDEAYDAADAGPRTVTAKVVLVGEDMANYTLTSVTPANATITPKALTASIVAESKVYDGNATASAQGSVTDVIGTDVVTVAVTGAAFNDKRAGTGKPVTAGVSISNPNYSLTSAEASTTANITPRDLTIAISAADKVYDGLTNAAVQATITDGRVTDDQVIANASNGAFDTKNVGNNKDVTASISISGADAANYTFNNSGSTKAAITPKAITVTAAAKAKMVNQTDPALTYTFSPALVGTDDFTGALTRKPGEDAGTYAIEQGTVSAGNNYNLTYVGANLIIHAIPTVVIENPAPVKYNTIVNVIASYTGIVNNPVWVWGFTANTDGVQGATSITGSATVPSIPGVHKLVLQYRNAVGDLLTTEPVFISVYDPESGFVTGGGWINSPMGALAGSDAIGKANFGFVAKYKKGNKEVEGSTEFQFQTGGINFKSSVHNAGSLVISGPKATYKGTGTIAGLSGTYDFMVVATDGQVEGGGGNDKFRIKIWNGGNVVYDNARGTDENAELSELTILGGGSIVIHEVKAVATSPKSSKVISEELEGISTARFDNYPNAFSDRTTIRFTLDTEQNFALEVYDIRGALVKKVSTGVAEAGKVYEYELDARNLAKGVYFARLATGSRIQTIKMLLKK